METMLNEEAYLRRKRTNWERLEELCNKADGVFRRLSGLEAVEFVRLYRSASADLAYLMTHSSNQDVVEHLNRLVGVAYGQLYRAPMKSVFGIIDDMLYAAASTFRRNRKYFWISVGFTLFSALFTFGVMQSRPDLRHHFVSPMMEENTKQWTKGGFPEKEAGEGLMATAFYVTNNPRAGMMTVSLGAASAGIGTTYVLWANGTNIGALASDMWNVRKLPFLLISISPHGVSEMGGFMVASAVGYLFAWAIIAPGRRSRADALRHAGKDGFVLYVLALIMISMAAPIEGFFSFNPVIPLWVKAIAALLAFSAWTLFFERYGLEREAEERAKADLAF